MDDKEELTSEFKWNESIYRARKAARAFGSRENLVSYDDESKSDDWNETYEIIKMVEEYCSEKNLSSNYEQNNE